MSDSEGYGAVADASLRDRGSADARRPARDAATGTPPAEPPARPAEAPASVRPPPVRQSWGRRLRWPLLIGTPALAVIVGLAMYLSGGRYASTDDAYLQAARVQISSNVPGRVIEVAVRENQSVRKGDVLFRLDPRDFDAAAQQATAALAASRQTVLATQAQYGQRAADLTAARATLTYQQKELVRQRALTAAGVSSEAQLDAQAHAVDVAAAQVQVAQQGLAAVLAQLGGSPSGSTEANPNVQQASAALSRAQLNLGYGVIRAPQDGIVTRVEQLQAGSYVNAAQPLFSLVAPRVWVEANFKEDQLAYMRVGQPATFKVDAYPGVVLRGRVESLSPGTGSSFSVLPPENATGNWVKVVQRLPVRLSVEQPARDKAGDAPPLHAGLSVKVSVDVDHHRSLFGSGRAGPEGARR